MTDYRNDTPQADRLETLLNDKRVQKDASTFLSHTHSEDSGRFAKPQHVVGETPAVEYPRQPPSSFSNQAAVVGPEENLGFDVNALEPVGTEPEILASLDVAPATQSVHVPDADAVERKEGGATPETSRGPLPPTAPSQDIASPNPSIETTITTDGKRRRL